MKTMTRAEYKKQSADHRGLVNGKPFLLYLDKETGGTVYGPVTISEVKPLTCCCCGESTHGRQWHNRDTGYGLCPKCAQWIATRETPETMHENYGEPGVHYFSA